jgi:hypothetical protein
MMDLILDFKLLMCSSQHDSSQEGLCSGEHDGEELAFLG